jgi:hypothetical protein
MPNVLEGSGSVSAPEHRYNPAVFESDTFTFNAPDGWRHERDGTRDVFLDGRGGVLIVSAAGVDPPSPDAARRVLDHALAAVEAAAADPALVTVDALAEQGAADGLRAWSMRSRSADGTVLFSQAVVAAGDAVLLATFESPAHGARHAEVFAEFFGSVRRGRS